MIGDLEFIYLQSSLLSRDSLERERDRDTRMLIRQLRTFSLPKKIQISIKHMKIYEEGKKYHFYVFYSKFAFSELIRSGPYPSNDSGKLST